MNLKNYLRVICVVLGLLLTSRTLFGRPTELSEKSIMKADANDTVNVTETELQKFSRQFLKELAATRYDSYPSGLSCRSCRIFLDVVRQFWTREGVSHFIAIQFTIRMCTALGIQHSEVCNGVVREYHNELYYIFSHVELGSDSLCSAIIDKDCGGVGSLDNPWIISLPETPKPPVEEVRPFKESSPVLKVLHLTDLHIDPEYKENTSSKCGEPMCCREENGPGDAGHWGSYGCDLPMRTFESALYHVKENHKDLSYIILTGDIPPHNVWQDTKKGQISIMQKALSKISEYFPDKKVFVAAGNHDTHPANSFPPATISAQYSAQWLLDSYADMWSVWLPNSSLSTVQKGGFYTTLVADGFRIVSINDNYCNKLNWWLLLNNTDPLGQLQWLVQVLQHAEDNQEKVHIIAHIPTGDNLCYKHWSWNYHKIINRYENTVTAQFCGHTHQDHFEIFYDLEDNNRPFSSLHRMKCGKHVHQLPQSNNHSLWYIAPSLTTSNKYQPSYRIYEIDGNHENSSRAVLDHKTFVLNLEESNKRYEAIWELEYSAKDAYNMVSLHPKNWDGLVKRMEKDDNLFRKFYKFKYRYPLKGPCNDECKKKELCAVRTARSHDKTLCNTTADDIIF